MQEDGQSKGRWQGSLFLLSADSIGEKPLGECQQQVEAGAEGHHLVQDGFGAWPPLEMRWKEGIIQEQISDLIELVQDGFGAKK